MRRSHLKGAIFLASMAKRKRTQEASDRQATLCSLPSDIMGKIIRDLMFQDKCSLEVVNKGMYDLLSKPVSADGLWGTCDLMSDLKFNDKFEHKDSIIRYTSCSCRRMVCFLGLANLSPLHHVG